MFYTEDTYLWLPHKSVGMGVVQRLHHSLNCSSYLLRIWITSLHNLQVHDISHLNNIYLCVLLNYWRMTCQHLKPICINLCCPKAIKFNLKYVENLYAMAMFQSSAQIIYNIDSLQHHKLHTRGFIKCSALGKLSGWEDNFSRLVRPSTVAESFF